MLLHPCLKTHRQIDMNTIMWLPISPILHAEEKNSLYYICPSCCEPMWVLHVDWVAPRVFHLHFEIGLFLQNTPEWETRSEKGDIWKRSENRGHCVLLLAISIVLFVLKPHKSLDKNIRERRRKIIKAGNSIRHSHQPQMLLTLVLLQGCHLKRALLYLFFLWGQERTDTQRHGYHGVVNYDDPDRICLFNTE